MNDKNLDYLKDNLKYMGFGENLYEALRASIMEGKKDFTLSLQTEINRQPFGATLHFRRSDNTDVYFFNKWEAELKNEVGKMQQTFYINKGSGITLKEGFNLLEGRAVYKELTNKEGQKYHAWLQLDGSLIDREGNNKLRQYHQNYGYDLEQTLSKFPIKELTQNDQKEKLLYSLQKGNMQAVTFEKNGFAEKLYIEAAPQFKSLNVYDHNGTRIALPELEKRYDVGLKKEQPAVTPVGRAKVNGKEVEGTAGQTYDQKTGVKQEAAKGVEQTSPAHKTSQLPKKEPAHGMLEKKRPSKGKGLHI
jgi:hypothetical protein